MIRFPLVGRVVLIALVAVLAAGLSATPALATPPPYLIQNGVSQPIYSYQKAIRETVWVGTGSDLDGDGQPDRAAVDIIRPSEPAARGQRVPVIMMESTYWAGGRGNEDQRKTYAPDGTPTGFPLFYDNYFVPRGYAIALMDAPGSSRATGCEYNLSEISAGEKVIDWLNGRVPGYRSPFGTANPVYNNWSTGAVGMIGKSYDGLLALGVGITGVPGLRTIVPIEADSNLYDFFSQGGTSVLAGIPWPGYIGTDNDRAKKLCNPLEVRAYREKQSGDYTPYWQQFNFTKSVPKMRASVLVTQGFQDENIPAVQFGQFWHALTVNNVPRKAWLTQAGHVDPFDLDRPAWVDTLHRWFDRWLLGVPNGIDHEPMITIEHTPDQWESESQWPPPGTRDQTLRPAAGPVAGLGTLTTRPSAQRGAESLVDSSDPNSDEFTWAEQPDQTAGNRVLFETAPLDHAVRLSGTASMTVRVRSSKSTATVTGELVDYGPATVRNAAGPNDATGIRNLTTRSCWGESSATDSACYLDTTADLVNVDHQIIGVGYADVGHYASPSYQLPLDPNRYYTRQVSLSTTDHIVPAGHRIGLIIGGTDNWWFYTPGAGATLSFDLAGTTATVPVAPGGQLG